MKYLSTFSGIGGFELGIQIAYESLCDADRSQVRGSQSNTQGDQRQGLLTTQGEDTSTEERPVGERTTDRSNQRPLCIGFSEIDKYATQIYQKHFPEHKNYGDITKINADDLPDFDLLVGGFPCQSFSIAGKRGGFEDTRGTMFFELARILRAKQSRLFVFENVKGLLSHDNGQTFRTIITTLDELGYDLQWQVLNSKNHGVPQNRERVFIIGHLRGTPRPKVFPFGEDNRSNNEQSELRTGRELLEGDELHTIQKEEEETASKPSGQIVRKDWNQPDDTDSRGGSSHSSYRIRRLTPTECERLQGFPDGWTEGLSDTQRYKCCGNAVTVNVIQDIFERLLKVDNPSQDNRTGV